MSYNLLSRADLVQDFHRLGIPFGGLLMVHSSLSSIGYVDGGSETVVDALLEVLGPEGTLVVPTFTDEVAREPSFVFDPLNTPSMVGAISEAVRRRPGARRSLHGWHSLAAMGPLAAAIAKEVGSSPWLSDGPMPKVIDYGGEFMLLGVPYKRLTLVHLMEWECGVAYRPGRLVEFQMRRPDGSLAKLVNLECPPEPPFPGNDFNRLGQAMEVEGVVRIGAVGNAIARVFQGRAVREVARKLHRKDKRAFLREGDVVTELYCGITVSTPRGDLCVLDPKAIHGT
jgi:aminoglycoside 3-N-acetyltransferase